MRNRCTTALLTGGATRAIANVMPWSFKMTEATLEIEKPKIELDTDPLFSVIVPIHDLKPDVLRRCLRSISIQNYSHLEVVLVLDGPNEDLRKVAGEYLKYNWKLIEIEHGGACAARNAGFNASSGEIVSFTNSDYILKRGIIRLWVDRMVANKDCGFLYGGYDFNSSNRFYYPSKPFDRFQLENANYIDCGFPVWRKYVVPWDVNCKSLQDWDFWIRVVKTHNVKGYYLEREVSFTAEPPRPKGLSNDSHDNWVERVKYVKHKNGIALHDIVVTSYGAPNHGVEIAKMIGADFRDDTILKPNEYKAVYMIGFYIKPDQSSNEHGPTLSSFKPKVKKIVHWVGADIFWLRKFSFENLHLLGGALKETGVIHLTENEAAQKELKDLIGADSLIVPIPPYNDYEIRPLPEEFTVSAFLTSKSDFDKYLKEHTLSIVRSMPDVKFTLYGDDAKNIHYPNVECRGNMSKEEWKKYVYENSCLLRLCRHDTTPLASAEFMMAGRSVVSNIKGECTTYIDTSGESHVNEWDKQAPGFSVTRWPETKKKIVRAIREIKKHNRLIVVPELKERFNRGKYIQKIEELAGVPNGYTNG